MIHELMEDFGFDKERLMLAWCSSAEPDKFVEAVIKMTTLARNMGPLFEKSEAPQAA
ncbi:MAG TPA: hydrogenase iron-sulfur subunit [Desulfobacterales bacterium]|nr:hydrogenase iron-sulfur subunit [Desulfobacterales bacterium]